MNRKDYSILLIFAGLILLWFWDLTTLRSAFLSGDHWEQQYPWAVFLQEQIRQFKLPWWTPDIHCGFPLLAEGQIGAFYPLNLIFFFFLPSKIAFNYIILFQYWLGAVIFYAYLRSLKLSVFACFAASLIWLFASTQGGYFYYNFISQKVVIWLPLTLLLIDRLVDTSRRRYGFYLAVIFAVQIFGGYLQVAIYSIFFSSLYFLFRWLQLRNKQTFFYFMAAGILAIFFSLVQLLPTLELSLLSSRADAPKGLAYVGSMNPLGFATLFFPSWDGLLGSELYIGLGGLLFAACAVFSSKSRHENFFCFAAILFLLLALGKFSPLYRAIVEITGFNSFRTPIKFLFFTAFSSAILCAFGIEKFILGILKPQPLKRISRLLIIICSIFIFLPPITAQYLSRNEPELLPQFQNLIVNAYHNKPGHPFSVTHYEDKAKAVYHEAIRLASHSTPHSRHERILLLVFCAFLLVLPILQGRLRLFRLLFLLFLLTDLYFYGFTSIRGGIEPFKNLHVLENSKIVDFIKSDHSIFRVAQIYSRAEDNRAFPVFPNSNMLQSIPDIGAYSPLVMKNYTQFLSGWGYVNNSLSVHLVDPEILLSHLHFLNLLNVKYVLSLQLIEHPDLRFLLEEKGVKLYQNLKVMPRAFFVPGGEDFSQSMPQNITPVKIDRYLPQSMNVSFRNSSEGYLFISDMQYPGWKVSHGMPNAEIEGAGPHKLFRKVRIVQPGEHSLQFDYAPVNFNFWGSAALLVFMTGLICIAKAHRKVKT